MVGEVGPAPGASYADLAAYLVNYGDVTDGVSDLSDLAAEVKTSAVRGLLLGRDPDILNPDRPEQFQHFLELLNGITTEVESITGSDPQPPVRKLALWAIALGTAADIEDALFPEQQLNGPDGTSTRLRGRYLAILAQLRGLPGAVGDGALGALSPIGSFPEPLPDPFEQYPTLHGRWIGRGYR